MTGWHADLIVGDRPPATAPDGTVGPRVPEEWCRLCWRDHVVCRDGHWWLDHIGPFATCTHSCHDGAGFLDSTS